MRHADAEFGSTTDHDRPLTAEGRLKASNVGVWMRNQQWQVDAVVSSTAARAIRTATLVHESLFANDAKADEVVAVDRLYNAPMSAYFDHIGTFPDDWNSVLVVGHNPAIGELVSRAADRRVPVVTATVADIHIPTWPEFSASAEAEGVYVPGGQDLLQVIDS